MTTYWLFSNKYFFCPHNDLLSNATCFLILLRTFLRPNNIVSWEFLALFVERFAEHQKKRKAMLVILRFVLSSDDVLLRTDFGSSEHYFMPFRNDNKNKEWFIWASKHFRRVFFFIPVEVSDDEMIFHVTHVGWSEDWVTGEAASSEGFAMILMKPRQTQGLVIVPQLHHTPSMMVE